MLLSTDQVVDLFVEYSVDSLFVEKKLPEIKPEDNFKPIFHSFLYLVCSAARHRLCS